MKLIIDNTEKFFPTSILCNQGIKQLLLSSFSMHHGMNGMVLIPSGRILLSEYSINSISTETESIIGNSKIETLGDLSTENFKFEKEYLEFLVRNIFQDYSRKNNNQDEIYNSIIPFRNRIGRDYFSISLYPCFFELQSCVEILFFFNLGFSCRIDNKPLIAFNFNSWKLRIFSIKEKVWNEDCHFERLTDLEKNVLGLSAKGFSVKGIAPIVNRAPETVKTIRKNIFEKLGASNVTQAFSIAIKCKLMF